MTYVGGSGLSRGCDDFEGKSYGEVLKGFMARVLYGDMLVGSESKRWPPKASRHQNSLPLQLLSFGGKRKAMS